LFSSGKRSLTVGGRLIVFYHCVGSVGRLLAADLAACLGGWFFGWLQAGSLAGCLLGGWLLVFWMIQKLRTGKASISVGNKNEPHRQTKRWDYAEPNGQTTTRITRKFARKIKQETTKLRALFLAGYPGT
jgi:hypothetical protein